MQFNVNEKLIRKSRGNYRGNYLTPFAWVGGTWYLTNIRLHFESNAFNIETLDESIPLESINSINMKHPDFISSKLTILLHNNSLIELHVPERKAWVTDIANEIKKIKNEVEEGSDLYSIINNKIVEKPKGWLIKETIQIAIVAVCVSVICLLFYKLLTN
ncbi:MAG: hypothetical protein GX654_08755 [Desulfatiglans sp.]|jgi:hypothetical protein|nr:hypothetical protein [Desulfatiglans sp.]